MYWYIFFFSNEHHDLCKIIFLWSQLFLDCKFYIQICGSVILCAYTVYLFNNKQILQFVIL